VGSPDAQPRGPAVQLDERPVVQPCLKAREKCTLPTSRRCRVSYLSQAERETNKYISGCATRQQSGYLTGSHNAQPQEVHNMFCIGMQWI